MEALLSQPETMRMNPPEDLRTRLLNQTSGWQMLPDIAVKHNEVGAQLVGGTPEQFRAYLGTELVKFGKLVKAAGIPAASGG